MFHTWYVDDMFLVFSGMYRQIDMMRINRNIKFIMEIKKTNSLNFLDLCTKRCADCSTLNTYWKPKTTDMVVHADFFPPCKQNMASFNAFVYRLLSFPLSQEDLREELNTIKFIAIKIGYSDKIIDRLIKSNKES